jgi:hypothetical protein
LHNEEIPIVLMKTGNFANMIEFLGVGALLALILTSKKLRDLVKEIHPSLISVPHMHLDSAALADWAVDKMGMHVEDLCRIKLGGWKIIIRSANILHVAVKYGQLAGINWSYEHGYTEDKDTSRVAAKYGQVEAMKRLRAHGCKWNWGTCQEAARHGQIPMLRYLLNDANPPCPVDSDAIYHAAEGGHLEALQFLRQEVNPPVTWSSDVCGSAAECEDHAQSVTILRWIHEEDRSPPPWGNASYIAAINGNLPALQYMRLEAPTKAKWNRAICLSEATDNGHPDMVEWINNQPAAEDDNASARDIFYQ